MDAENGEGMTRDEVLSTAKNLISGDRASTYGDVIELHTIVARLWTETLRAAGMAPEKPLDAHVVLWMMTDLKKARALKGSPHDDNYVDAAGYTALAAEASR